MSATAPTTFSELLLHLYRLSSERSVGEFQDDALSLVKAVLPFDAAMWGTATVVDEAVDVHTLHLHEKAPQMMVEYDRVKQHDRIAAGMLTQERATGGFNIRENASSELCDFLGRHEQNNIFITSRQNLRTRFEHWLSLFRVDDDALCRASEVALLDGVAPHLMQSLAMNRALHLSRLGPASTVPKGSAICDVRGSLHQSDPCFDAMLRKEWNDWPGNRLPRPLLEHLSDGNGWFRGRTLVMRREVEHQLLFLQVRARCAADGLTPRERTVASLFGQGLTHKEVARRLDRAPSTVRNQLQSIYDKLGVHNVAELVEQLRLAA